METRRIIKPTSLSERTEFLKLWVKGKSARSIARAAGTSATTVCRWIRRWKLEGNVDNKYWTRSSVLRKYPRKLTDPQKTTPATASFKQVPSSGQEIGGPTCLPGLKDPMRNYYPHSYGHTGALLSRKYNCIPLLPYFYPSSAFSVQDILCSDDCCHCESGCNIVFRQPHLTDFLQYG